MKYLLKHALCESDKRNYITRALIKAARNGHLDIVEYLYGEGGKFTHRGCCGNFSVIEGAAENGHLNVVKFLVEKGAKINSYETLNRAFNGNIDVFKYLV